MPADGLGCCPITSGFSLCWYPVYSASAKKTGANDMRRLTEACCCWKKIEFQLSPVRLFLPTGSTMWPRRLNQCSKPGAYTRKRHTLNLPPCGQCCCASWAEWEGVRDYG